jgi:hypothetical protein
MRLTPNQSKSVPNTQENPQRSSYPSPRGAAPPMKPIHSVHYSNESRSKCIACLLLPPRYQYSYTPIPPPGRHHSPPSRNTHIPPPSPSFKSLSYHVIQPPFYSPFQGTISISGGSVNPLSCSQALIFLSLSSHALHTPPPKTRVWRRQPSAAMTSPETLTEELDEVESVFLV